MYIFAFSLQIAFPIHQFGANVPSSHIISSSHLPLRLAQSLGALVLKLGVEHVAAADGGDVVACSDRVLVISCGWSDAEASLYR